MREQRGAICAAPSRRGDRRRSDRAGRGAGGHAPLTPTSAARPPTSCSSELRPARSPRRRRNSCRASTTSARPPSARPNTAAVSVMALDAAALAKPDDVTDADARGRYEQSEGESTARPSAAPSSRSSSRSQAEAEAAAAKIKDGDDLRGDRAGAERLRQGSRTRHLHQGRDARSGGRRRGLRASEGRRQRAGRRPVRPRASSASPMIQPEAVRPFEEVAGRDPPGARAVQRAQSADRRRSTTRSRISAPRAKPARRYREGEGPRPRPDPAADRPGGRDKAGKPSSTCPSAKRSCRRSSPRDIGVDNEALRIAQRRLCLVRRDRHRSGPREDPRRGPRSGGRRLWRDERGRAAPVREGAALTERLDKGESDRGRGDRSRRAGRRMPTDLARNAAKDDLSAEAVNRIFAVPVGKAGNVANGADARAVFKVTAATVPPFVTTTQEAAQNVENQLKTGMGDDLISAVHRPDPPGSRRHHQPAGAEAGDRQQRPLGHVSSDAGFRHLRAKPMRRARPASSAHDPRRAIS